MACYSSVTSGASSGKTLMLELTIVEGWNLLEISSLSISDGYVVSWELIRSHWPECWCIGLINWLSFLTAW